MPKDVVIERFFKKNESKKMILEKLMSRVFFHFSGQDVLQVYNVQQVKHRLQTAACYIANTKPTGFTLEVSNNDNAIVIVGELIYAPIFFRQITTCRSRYSHFTTFFFLSYFRCSSYAWRS